MISIILAVFFYLGAEAGQSFPWSSKWQTNKFKQRLPEILLAIMFTGFANLVYQNIGLSTLWQVILFPVSLIISYAGIESATWKFIQWDSKHPSFDKGRTSTTKRFVDWLAWKVGKWEQGEEGYSWTACTVKGTIICLPFALILAPVGGLFFAFGYEIGSHAKKYLHGFNLHIISEGMSFALVGAFGLFIISL